MDRASLAHPTIAVTESGEVVLADQRFTPEKNVEYSNAVRNFLRNTEGLVPGSYSRLMETPPVNPVYFRDYVRGKRVEFNLSRNAAPPATLSK